MITRLGVKNFKKFHDTTTVSLSDINIFVGTNSSGKSSFIKSLILMTDNLMKRVNLLQGGVISNKILFDFNSTNFESANLGTFKRVINHDTQSESFTLEANIFDGYNIGTKEYKLDVLIQLEVQNDEDNADIGYLSRVLVKDNTCGASFNFNLREWTTDVTFPKDRYYKLMSICLDDRHIKHAILEHEIPEKDVLNFTIPMQPIFFGGKDLLSSLFHSTILKIKYHSHANSYEIPREELAFHGTCAEIEGVITPKEVLEQYSNDLLQHIHGEQNIPNIEYIYPHAVTRKVIFSVHDRNDYVAHTIYDAYTHKALYNKDAISFVRHWLSRFRIGYDCTISTVEGEGYIIQIIDERGRRKNLIDLGTGSAQIVLLLLKVATIMTFYNRNSTLIIMEEPEQNLHPNYQSLLADLFFDIYNHGVRMIVETHSEYLIRRSQVIVAEIAAEKGFSQEELDKSNPFRVIYFPEAGQPYDMHYKTNGDFEHLFGEGFYDAAAMNKIALYRMQLNLNK